MGNSDDKLERARRELLAELRALGIRDERVLSAMARVPRHLF
ncbi:MAG TPA: protein-L-isoaspartate O-methyltransferase, partial [Candidatus Acetothermia bacterium]|nr:protein-L-isoaspartate O-methyltransferase [Candidatus Acetothermia bacterium]